MVYLALTPQGLQEILDTPEAAAAPVWCGANALSEAEFAKLERSNVIRFTYSLANAEKATIQRALWTIEEHHPGERIWVESVIFEDLLRGSGTSAAGRLQPVTAACDFSSISNWLIFFNDMMSRFTRIVFAVIPLILAAPASGLAVELSGTIYSSTGKLPPGIGVVAESPDGLPDIVGKVDGGRYRIDVPDVGRIRLRLKASGWNAATKYVWTPKRFNALDFLIYPAEVPEAALAAELIEMGKQDQLLRQGVGPDKLQDPVFVKHMNDDDIRREKRLSAIINAKGWPLTSTVGDAAVHAAWEITQHASPAFLKRCLPLMQDAVDKLELAPGLFALSVDRVRVNEGKPQVYGSQLHTGKDGKLVLDPIEDREHVDIRRATAGMEPLADYLKHFEK